MVLFELEEEVMMYDRQRIRFVLCFDLEKLKDVLSPFLRINSLIK